MREQWRALRYLIVTTFRAEPLLALGSLFDAAGALALFVGPLFIKILIDGVVEGDRASVVRGAVGIAVLPGLAFLLGWAGTRARITLSQRMGFVFDAHAAEVAAHLPGLEHLERPEHLDRHQMVSQGSQALGRALNHLLNLLSTLVRTITLYLTVATVSPWLLGVALFGLPSIWAQTLIYRWNKAATEAAAPRRRLAQHLEAVVGTAAGGREIRVFGIEDAVARRRHHEETAAAQLLDRVRLKAAPLDLGLGILSAGAVVIAVAFTLSLAFDGRATVGEVGMVLTLAGLLPVMLTAFVSQVQRLLGEILITVNRLLWLVDYAEEQKQRYSGSTPPPDHLTEGIVLDAVSFRYPGTEQWVLRDFSCTLDAGQVTAIVGDNGAGKTTLVKLLCRFYDPDEGRILVDGVDLRDLDIEAWRQRLTMANQDFARLELLVGETVGVGHLPLIDDEPAVAVAIDWAGGSDVVERLDSGLSTQLGRQWQGGTDLSMGQWQKLALARGLMRQTPLLQLFDEPTASLDAGTEHALFERLAHASTEGATRERGAVTVLVSHRFSTVRAADRILVIDDGKLVENGSHAELVRTGGLYAELYEIQAAAYR